MTEATYSSSSQGIGGATYSRASLVTQRYKESDCSAVASEDMGSIPGWGTSPGRRHATHSSILAWRIPWTEETGRLQSIGLQRVGHG